MHFFFSAILFSTYFAHYLAIFLLVKGFPGVPPALSMDDCCIRVIHNMVTALLEYLNLLAVNPVCDYSSRVSPSLQCKIG